MKLTVRLISNHTIVLKTAVVVALELVNLSSQGTNLLLQGLEKLGRGLLKRIPD